MNPANPQVRSNPTTAGNPLAAGASKKVERRGTAAGSGDGFDEPAVLGRARSGNAAAFGELVVRYQDRVFNAAWRICRNEDDAADVTQEAFLKAYESLDSFGGRSGFYTWLFRIAVNAAISRQRRRKRHATVSLDGHDDGNGRGPLAVASVSGSGDPTPGPETRQRVARALDELDPEHRAIVVLKDIEAFNYQQIGDILDLPQGTVKSRLHRARTMLRTKLAGVVD